MDRLILGALGALLLTGVGLFWWQGRAQVEQAAPPPMMAETSPADDPDVLPAADPGQSRGPAPPEATELSKEQRRFFRYDRNRDLRITRNEMLSSRTAAFRKLDTDGNNLLTFEEWAVTTATRFDDADANGDRELDQKEFATTRLKRSASKPRCNC
ncbi:EF-hand domain-containing protein [Qipengyuania sp. JC766]|uniref:EF-hand domain-containing protein n=1 Tax=Qipengyuania sp. JC766 TaxID=3232139 RepID=UPI003457A3AA